MKKFFSFSRDSSRHEKKQRRKSYYFQSSMSSYFLIRTALENFYSIFQIHPKCDWVLAAASIPKPFLRAMTCIWTVKSEPIREPTKSSGATMFVKSSFSTWFFLLKLQVFNFLAPKIHQRFRCFCKNALIFTGVTSGVQSFIGRANFSWGQKSSIARHSKAPQWQLHLHCLQPGGGGHFEPCGHHCHV